MMRDLGVGAALLAAATGAVWAWADRAPAARRAAKSRVHSFMVFCKGSGA